MALHGGEPPADLPPGLSDRIDATGLPATHGAALPTQSPSQSPSSHSHDTWVGGTIRTFGSSRLLPQDSNGSLLGFYENHSRPTTHPLQPLFMPKTDFMPA